MLSYLPRTRPRHEFITLTPEGFRFRQQIFETIPSLFRWFKDHFRDPVPQTPRAAAAAPRTPFTPGAGFNINSEWPARAVNSGDWCCYCRSDVNTDWFEDLAWPNYQHPLSLDLSVSLY